MNPLSLLIAVLVVALTCACIAAWQWKGERDDARKEAEEAKQEVQRLQARAERRRGQSLAPVIATTPPVLSLEDILGSQP